MMTSKINPSKNKIGNKKYLIFDADHTLIAYREDEREAFRRTYARFSIEASERLLEFSGKTSEEVWTEEGLYDVQSERIQREYHILYRTHLEKVFAKISAKFSLQLVPALCKEAFLEELCIGGTPIEGSVETIKALSRITGGKYVVAIATNGLHDIQTGRLKGLLPYVDEVFISEDLGAIKPSPAFFQKMVERLGAKKENCLMIGDSIVSDIDGALSFGMDALLFNPKGKKIAAPCTQITSLYELLEILE